MHLEEDYAVVFSGGGALGAWEVGCLEAIVAHHRGRLPTIVTGASAGAINAAGLTAGMSIEELKSTWAGLTNDQIYVMKSFRSHLLLAALGFLSRKTLKKSMADQVKRINSIFDTVPLYATLQKILEDREHDFLSSPIIFAVSATRLADGESELFYKLPPGQSLPESAEEGRFANSWKRVSSLALLLQALQGTSALPVLFPPMEGRFDGGVLLNQPISPAILLGATNLYVLIPSVIQIGDTRDLLAIGNTMMATWLAMSLTSQIELIKVRNKMRVKMKDKAPLRVCVVRPGLDLGQKPGVGLLSFGKEVRALIELGHSSAADRLKRFDPEVEYSWY